MSEQKEVELKKLKKAEREQRKALKDHCEFVRLFVNFLDSEQQKPSTELRGKRIAEAMNQLEMANDRIRYGVLGVDFRKDKPSRRKMPHCELEALRAQNYRVTVTIEATAPAAAHSFCGKGATVEEAVRSLGEMMAKAKEAK